MTDPRARLEQAFAAQRAGAVDAALADYDAILRDDPACADALHLSALILFERGDRPEALARIDRAVAITPQAPVFHSNRGQMLARAGDPAAALAAYDAALAIAPLDPAATLGKAQALLDLGRVAEAIDDLAFVADLDPRLTALYGSALLEGGRAAEALPVLNKAVHLRPFNALGYARRGVALRVLGRLDQALADFERALDLDPGLRTARRNRAAIWGAHGRAAAAEAELRALLAENPDDALVLADLALVCDRACRLPDALALLDRALAVAPGRADLHANRASLRQRLGQFAEAGADLDAAIQAAPTAPGHWSNRASLHLILRDFDRALDDIDQALALAPDFPEAVANRALVRLTDGDYEGGFRDLEARWRLDHVAAYYASRLRLPAWNPSDPLARYLLVWWEQGFGDQIMCARFAAWLPAPVRVLLEAPPALARLFSESFSDNPRIQVVTVAGPETPPKAHDGAVAICSLPRLLGIGRDRLPGPGPYLTATVPRVAAMRAVLPPQARIALAWAGNPRAGISRHVGEDARRSLHLRQLLPLLAQAPGRFVSVQIGAGREQLADIPEALRPFDAAPLISDFADTAAVLACVDLVISIDSAVLHLAGAMGRSAWMLSRWDADWRWGHHDRASPWYPTLTGFYQPRPGDWEAVIEAVGYELAGWLGTAARDAPGGLLGT